MKWKTKTKARKVVLFFIQIGILKVLKIIQRSYHSKMGWFGFEHVNFTGTCWKRSQSAKKGKRCVTCVVCVYGRYFGAAIKILVEV